VVISDAASDGPAQRRERNHRPRNGRAAFFPATQAMIRLYGSMEERVGMQIDLNQRILEKLSMPT